MTSLTSPSVKQDISVLSINQQLALVLFYRPEQCHDLINLYCKSNQLPKPLTFELKKVMKDIIQQTQTILKQRGYLRGSMMMGSEVYKLVDLIVSQGSNSHFRQYFLRYHCAYNTQTSKDRDLITFYNKVIDLWSQHKKHRIEQLNLSFKLIRDNPSVRLHIQNNLQQIQSKKSQQQNNTIDQSIHYYIQNSPSNHQLQYNIKKSSNASLQFFTQFTSDLIPIDSIILSNANYKKRTKFIPVLESQQPSLTFQCYDDLSKVLLDIILVAVNSDQPRTKQYEFD